MVNWWLVGPGFLESLHESDWDFLGVSQKSRLDPKPPGPKPPINHYLEPQGQPFINGCLVKQPFSI